MAAAIQHQLISLISSIPVLVRVQPRKRGKGQGDHPTAEDGDRQFDTAGGARLRSGARGGVHPERLDQAEGGA
eukprot:scaffold197588_cov18-Tisochrysis_lutea.AAC.2